jgi:hypothetical protein
MGGRISAGGAPKVAGREIPYLFWEGPLPGHVGEGAAGFDVEGKDAVAFFERVLPKLGLNSCEIFDFVVFWAPQLARHAHNFVWFETDEYAKRCPMRVEPAPDAIIRIMMIWEVVDEPRARPEQALQLPARSGFVVVEWGGVILGDAE